jgi:Ca-activated chloride channel family protein
MSATLPLAIFFNAPTALLGLLLIPLALLAQRAFRRRSQRYAVRFTGVSTLRAVVGTTPLWRRAVPPALAVLAMAALVVALAEPHRRVAVPAEQASVVLVTDHSRSMMATDVSPTRLEAARDAALRFIDNVPGPVRVGAVAYSDAPDAVQAPTTRRDDVRRIVEGLVADGSTATGDALAAALQGINQSRQDGKRPPAAIVLLSDGKTTTGRDPFDVAREAARARIPIYTVALGTPGATIPNPYPYASPLPVPPDPVTLRRIAEESRGRAYTVEDAGALNQIYQRLGSSIGTRTRDQEITAVFAVGGLLLLAGAALTSMRFAGRLP